MRTEEKRRKKEAGVISRDTFQRFYLLALLAQFQEACYGALRVHKVSYEASKKSPLKPFEYKKHYYGQYSDDVATVLEQLLSMGYVSASPLKSGKGNQYTVRARDLQQHYHPVLERISKPVLQAIANAVQEYGYLSEQELIKRAYEDSALQAAKEQETILKADLPEQIEVIGLSNDECDELELTMCPSFVTAMSVIARGFRQSKVDWSRVKKVAKFV